MHFIWVMHSFQAPGSLVWRIVVYWNNSYHFETGYWSLPYSGFFLPNTLILPALYGYICSKRSLYWTQSRSLLGYLTLLSVLSFLVSFLAQRAQQMAEIRKHMKDEMKQHINENIEQLEEQIKSNEVGFMVLVSNIRLLFHRLWVEVLSVTRFYQFNEHGLSAGFLTMNKPCLT